jgi:hypothetical protein
MPTSSTGLLIIRTHVETESSPPLRAQIRLTSDVSTGIERTLNLVDADVVAQVVRTWLKEILDCPTVGSGRHGEVTRR